MSTEVEVLANFGREAHLRRKWLKMWAELGCRVLRMPKWMQDIVLEDINQAVRSRIATMEMIHKCRKES